MKTLKTFAVAALMCSYLTNCQNAAPTPDTTNTNVVVTPPTPVTPNKCDNVKNPLEEIQWLKEEVEYAKKQKNRLKITQYTYKEKPIYFIEVMEMPTYLKYVAFLRGCDTSIQMSCSSEGAGGCTVEYFYNILSKSTNPVILFEQK